jgi:hypothetical protein
MTVRALGIVCATLALTACASNAILSSAWHDDAYKRKTFERILVVGVSEDQFRRRGFESAVVDALTGNRTEAISSIEIMDADTALTDASVDAAGDKIQADAVLVTRLTNTTVQAKEIDSRVDVQAQAKGGNIVDFFRYDYKDVENPGYLQAKISFVLSSNLYETAGGTLVYSIETVTSDKNTDYNSVVFDIIENTSVKIGQRLRRDGLAK